MDTCIPDSNIITPHLLHDQASILINRATALMVDAQYAISSEARRLLEGRARDLRQQAAEKDAEAAKLEAMQ